MNLELVETVVTLMREFPVSEIEVKREGQHVRVRRPLLSTTPAVVSAAADIAVAENLPADSDPFHGPAHAEAVEARPLTALMVGIFHQTEPPLSYAAEVRTGQVVGYIESMKLMNDVVAEENGQVVDVLAEDGAPVEYGQVLFRLATIPSV